MLSVDRHLNTLLPKPLGNIKRVPELNGCILLNEPCVAQRLIRLMVHTEFRILSKSQRKPYNPVQLGGVELVFSLAVGKEIDIAVQHDPVLVEIEIRMSHITKQRYSGVVRPCKVTLVHKEPAATGIGRQVLIGKYALPPTEILFGLKSRSQQPIGIRLDETALVKRRIALVLDTPAEPIDHSGESIGTIPFSQNDPTLGAI